VNTRNEWIKDVVDINDLHHMMCDVANGRTDEEPSRSDVKQFIESMDVNGDNHLHVSEFLTYMMRGLVQSQASMIRFSERSSMHHAVCCFLMNVDARHRKDDDHISLDNDQMEDLLHEGRSIPIFGVQVDAGLAVLLFQGPTFTDRGGGWVLC